MGDGGAAFGVVFLPRGVLSTLNEAKFIYASDALASLLEMDANGLCGRAVSELFGMDGGLLLFHDGAAGEAEHRCVLELKISGMSIPLTFCCAAGDHCLCTKEAEGTDPLTGFFDRSAVRGHIDRYLGKEGRTGVHALFVADLDNFKSINDIFGRDRCDELISTMSEALKKQFTDGDILGRTGGDEFVALMRNVGDIAAVRKKADELVGMLQFICSDTGMTAELSASVGVSVFPGDGRRFGELYTVAGAALHQAKKAGKGTYAISGAFAEENALDADERINAVQLRTLIDNMDAGVVLAEIKGEDISFTYASPGFFKTMGRSREEAGRCGERLMRFVHEEDIQALRSALIASADADERLDTTYRVYEPHGVTGWRHLRAACLPIVDTGVRTMLGVITNITELKRSAIQLEERYDRALEMRGKIDGNAIGSFRLNLTKDWCGDGNAEDSRILAMQSSQTADGFFAQCSKLCADTAQREEFARIFDRERLIARFHSGRSSQSYEYKFAQPGERPIWILTSIMMMQNPDNGDVEAIIYSRDIDAERTARAIVDRFIQLEYEFMALIDVKTGIISVVNGNTRDYVLDPPSDHELYSDTIEKDIPKFVVDSEVEECQQALSFSVVQYELENHDQYTCSFSVIYPDGRLARKKWQYTYLDESRDVIAFTRSDITDLYTAQTDPVTGIYNREKFYSAARRLIDANPEIRFAIARFDIDHFKAFNELYGIAEGDRMLREVGSAFRRMKIKLFLYGHMEADHFICCLPVYSLYQLPTLHNCELWLHNKHPEFDFSVRMGVYCIEDPALEVSLMSDRALLALRSVKGMYAERFAFYNDSMRAAMLEEQELVGEMRMALDRREFDVYLQPQYNFLENTVAGAEALVRWLHPVKGLISPAKFIPLFERNGFIIQLDRYVWERVCALMRKWIDAGLDPVPVSVNISRMDVYNQKLAQTLCALVEKYGLEPGMLRLEITESAYMDDPGQLVSVVEQLQSKGFFVEMDDFGSGYSSLNTLKDVPVDMLKLDMRFIDSRDNSGRGGIILNSVVRLAHWLGLPVIAEGVEDARQVDYLKTIGCTLAQGFYFARPMPVQEFERLLENSHKGGFSESFTTASFFDSEDFWDPQSQSTVIFNSIVGAAGLFEYNNGNLEALRVNDKYYDTVGTNRELLHNVRNRMLDFVHPEDLPDVIEALETAGSTESETEIETRWVRSMDDPETPVWLRIRVRCIARSHDRFVFYAAIENITEKKLLLERDAKQRAALKAALYARRAEDERNRILIQNTGTTLLDYDPHKDIMECQLRTEDGITSFTRENCMEKLPQNKALHPDDIAPLAEALHKAAGAPMRGKAEYRYQFPGKGYRWMRMDYVSIADDAGRVHRIVGAVNDIQYERSREALIGSLAEKLKSRRNALNGSTIAERVFDALYEAEDIEAATRSILATLGEHYDVSRAYIFEDSDNHAYCSSTFEWCAKGVQPFTKDTRAVYYGRDLSGSYMDNYDENGVLSCSDVSTLPEQERRLVESQGIRSMVQCAIMENGVYFGFIGFGDCRTTRVWTPDEISTLTLVSRYISAFLMKSRRYEEASFIDSIRESVDAYSSYMYIVDPNNYRVIYSNRAIRDNSGESFAGKICYEEFCAREAPCEGCPVTAMREGRKMEPVEIRRPSDGMWLLTQASRIHLPKRDMALMTCVDISKYKQQ